MEQQQLLRWWVAFEIADRHINIPNVYGTEEEDEPSSPLQLIDPFVVLGEMLGNDIVAPVDEIPTRQGYQADVNLVESESVETEVQSKGSQMLKLDTSMPTKALSSFSKLTLNNSTSEI
ncbi:hypothetical protein ScPMuIL_003966 [Solemya velum]